jgi:hypothetical protein
MVEAYRKHVLLTALRICWRSLPYPICYMQSHKQNTKQTSHHYENDALLVANGKINMSEITVHEALWIETCGVTH